MPSKVIVIDSVFPQENSGYRIPEFNYYLDNINDIDIFSSILNDSGPICPTTGLKKNTEVYFEKYPQNIGRIHPLDKDYISTLNIKCFYTIFLINAYNLLPLFEKTNKEFVFTLYPGGGFDFNSGNNMLVVVLTHPLLKSIITTQKRVFDYINRRFPYLKDKIHYIYGGPLNVDDLYDPNTRFVNNSGKYNICFVAHKNGINGKDKGYPDFVDLARLISKDFDTEFHIVGNFDRNDVKLDEVLPKFVFHGIKSAGFFKSFYRKMDAIISPINGGYDTTDVFMNGGTVEATLAGVIAFITDPHNQAQHFDYRDGKDMVILEGNVEQRYSIIKKYLENPEELCNIGINGSNMSYKYFNNDVQLKPRMELILK